MGMVYTRIPLPQKELSGFLAHCRELVYETSERLLRKLL